jgi:hypothetical protein
MQRERRSGRRARVSLFLNQYIDGAPHLAEAVELSMSGALVRRVIGPEIDRASYALELAAPGRETERVWLCASPIWRIGAFEAVRFVAQGAADRLKLANLIGAVAA